MKIYDTYLCSQNIENITPRNIYENNFSLIINYNLSFDAKILAQSSIKEMKKYYKLESEENYYNKLLNIFPNVKRGDVIEAKYKDGIVELYYNQKFTGTIADENFSKMFLDIWLHPKNQYKNMHKHLFNI